jgi:hypothetical protein
MNHYPSFEGLTKACHGVSSRISFENQLVEAPRIFLKKENEITAVFYDFMAAAQTEFLNHSADNSLVRFLNK